MRTRVLGGLAAVAGLPLGAALLQGCLDCGPQSVDLWEAEGSYLICAGDEHTFETSDIRPLHVRIELDDPNALYVDFGSNEVERTDDAFVSTNRILTDPEAMPCTGVADDAPLVVTTSEEEVRYELLIEGITCGGDE